MNNRHDHPSESFAPPSEGELRPTQPSRSLAHGAPTAGSVSADTLSDVLRTVRLTGALFFLQDCSSPWVQEIPEATAFAPTILPGAQQLISYHFVTNGRCWGRLMDGPSVCLDSGDILLIPHGDPYVLSSAPGLRAKEPVERVHQFFRQMTAGQLPFIVTQGGGGPDHVHLICGFLGCDVHPFNPVLATLPRLVHLRRPPGSGADRLGHLIEFAVAESRERRSGGRCVLLRLSELMFVEVVRRYLEALPTEQTGWLAGLRDPIVGNTLALLHDRPAYPWTLERLAKEVGSSRSTLADRFTNFVGQAPMQYLTHWRMQLAARLLADGMVKVCAVALEVGYDSEAAFSRAFKRIVGDSPATWRKRAIEATTVTR